MQTLWLVAAGVLLLNCHLMIGHCLYRWPEPFDIIANRPEGDLARERSALELGHVEPQRQHAIRVQHDHERRKEALQQLSLVFAGDLDGGLLRRLVAVQFGHD